MQADSAKVRRLLKTARGQIDGILKMVEEDQYCVDISAQIMAAQAVLGRANKDVLRAHLHSCVQSAISSGNEEAAQAKIDELCGILDKLSK